MDVVATAFALTRSACLHLSRPRRKLLCPPTPPTHTYEMHRTKDALGLPGLCSMALMVNLFHLSSNQKVHFHHHKECISIPMEMLLLPLQMERRIM